MNPEILRGFGYIWGSKITDKVYVFDHAPFSLQGWNERHVKLLDMEEFMPKHKKDLP